MNISLDDIITDDNDTEDIISESQPDDSTGMYMLYCGCIEEYVLHE